VRERIDALRRALESAHATMSATARVLARELPELARTVEEAAARADAAIRLDWGVEE
jgi:ABC-type transporter Mla subunit MlaD